MKPSVPDESDLALGPTLAFLSALWALNHAIEKASKRMQARLSVTAQQRMLLRVIGSFPGITPGRLARIVHLDPGTISTAIGRLEQAGVLERRQGQDGRSFALWLTSRGRAIDVPDPQTIEGALERTLARTQRKGADEVQRFIQRFIAEIEADRESPAAARPRAAKPRPATRARNGARGAR